MQWAAAAGQVETLRWLQSRGLELGHVNAANHGAIVKAAWKGHRDALEWLLHADDGPRLTSQLLMPDLEGRTVDELVRLNGQEAVANWLQGLIAQLRVSKKAATTRTPGAPPPGREPVAAQIE